MAHSETLHTSTFNLEEFLARFGAKAETLMISYLALCLPVWLMVATVFD